MAQQLNNMKEAVKGRGGGLQQTSTLVGDTIAENSGTQSSGAKKADEASASLNEFGKGSAAPTSDGPVKGAQQIENQNSGTADHLGLGGK